MPDENSTWVVQNQQTSSNQTWDDFVLDFWEWENEESKSSAWETVDSDLKDEIKDESLDNQQDENTDFDQNDLFWGEEAWDAQKNEEDYQDLNSETEDETMNNDFDISLDSEAWNDELWVDETRDNESYPENGENQELVNDGNYSEETVDELQDENDDNLNSNNNEDYDNEDYSEQETEKWNLENDSYEQMPENQDENDDYRIFFDEKPDETPNMDWEDDNINSFDEGDNNENMEINNSNEELENDYENNEEDDFDMEYDNEDWEDNKVESNEENWDMNQIISEEENNISDVENTENETNPNIDLQENNSENFEETESMTDNLQDESMNNPQSNWVDEDGDINKSEEKSDNNLDFVMDFNPEGQDNNEIKQPEIQDLMWKDSIQNFQDESEEINKTEEIIQNNSNVSDNFENTSWSGYENLNQWENLEVNGEEVHNFSEENNTENSNDGSQPSFMENDEESQTSKSENIQNTPEEKSNSSTQEMPVYDLSDVKLDYLKNEADLDSNMNLNNQTIWESQQNEVNNVNVSIQGTPEIQNKADNNVETHVMRSTLSLDQILDSELTNNPKFADNSKAVPRNVPTNSWFFSNKRLVWIVAWIWIFLLAWFVAVLAFPSKGTERKTWDVVDETWSQIVESHDVAPDTAEVPAEEPGAKEWGKTAGSTVQEFPDPDQWWDDIWELGWQDQWMSEWGDGNDDPIPFIWDIEEDPEIIPEDFSMADIVPTIANFKNQAEFYYSLWEENQDKKLIKYAVQTINLCETYQSQIENWEWLNEESFNSFKEKARSSVKKMENYLWWWEETETVRKSNYNEEYYFTWKDELRDFINERANS